MEEGNKCCSEFDKSLRGEPYGLDRLRWIFSEDRMRQLLEHFKNVISEMEAEKQKYW